MRKKRPPQLVVTDADAGAGKCGAGGGEQVMLRGTRHRAFFSLAARMESPLRSFDRGAGGGGGGAVSRTSAGGGGAQTRSARPLFSEGAEEGTYWVAARRGSKRTELEDAWSTLTSAAGGSMFAVFDGHGGTRVSELCKNSLLHAVEANASASSPSDALRKAFALIDERARELERPAKNSSTAGECTAGLCGSTASVVWIRSGVLHVASVGDSKAVLATNDGRAVELTRDHRATSDDEVAQVEGRGGFVLMNRVNGVLAVSRAIGDHSLKPVISAEPDVLSRAVASGDELLILASDGLWDVMPSQQAVDLALGRYRNEVLAGFSIDKSLKGISNALLSRALELGATDDITVMVLNMHAFRPQPPSTLALSSGGLRTSRFRESQRMRRLESGAAADDAPHAAFCKMMSSASDDSIDDVAGAQLCKRRSTTSTVSVASATLDPLASRSVDVTSPSQFGLISLRTSAAPSQCRQSGEFDDFSLSSLTSGVTLDGTQSVPSRL
uniref:PPM-type phosphatase domain-containing protein n=1 Tax=Erythrolobus australicus TaxID=1077150 RepID=A0A7S1XI08_9RHOD